MNNAFVVNIITLLHILPDTHEHTRAHLGTAKSSIKTYRPKDTISEHMHAVMKSHLFVIHCICEGDVGNCRSFRFLVCFLV